MFVLLEDPQIEEPSQGWVAEQARSSCLGDFLPVPDDEWVILHFGPEILADAGVVFSTTNNVYEDTIHRARGLGGFEQMFAERVPWGYHGSTQTRWARAGNETTCPQAEVLYPFELRLEFLHTITVGDDPTYETVEAILGHVDYNPYIELNPEAFR